MRAIQRMRRAIREQRYRISAHANEEMSEDELVAEDIESIILTGQIARKFPRDPRGTRYEVAGDTVDGRRAYVVCRFLPSSVLLIITAYVEEEGKVMKMTTNDVCEFCGGKVEQRVIRARFHFKGQTIYVDRVPAWVCAKCGEQYFDAPVYKRLEELARHSSRIEKTVCFPLAEYDTAVA